MLMYITNYNLTNWAQMCKSELRFKVSTEKLSAKVKRKHPSEERKVRIRFTVKGNFTFPRKKCADLSV